MAKVDLFPDLREFLELLNSAKVRYLVLGGYAVIHYGYRRVTDDLDVWIAIDPDNTQRVSEVLQSFGWPPADIVDLGDITASRATEMYLPLWLRLMSTVGGPTFSRSIGAPTGPLTLAPGCMANDSVSVMPVVFSAPSKSNRVRFSVWSGEAG